MNRVAVFIKYQPVNCEIDIHPFILGMARLFDFAGHLDFPGKKKTREQIDKESLQSDLISIGNDFRSVIEKLQQDAR